MKRTRQIINIILVRWNNKISMRDVADREEVVVFLRDKITAANFELSSVIPDHLLLYCSVCACEDKRLAQVLLKEILMESKQEIKSCIQSGNILTSNIIHKIESNAEFPIMKDGRIRRKYERLWIEQHIENSDRANTQEYWVEVLK